MVPEELRKWVAVFERVTSTTAIILLVLYFVWHNTGERNQALFAAKASAEESAAVGRIVKTLMEGHVKMASEESAISRMILVQICINTAGHDRQAINQCANYR